MSDKEQIITEINIRCIEMMAREKVPEAIMAMNKVAKMAIDVVVEVLDSK